MLLAILVHVALVGLVDGLVLLGLQLLGGRHLAVGEVLPIKKLLLVVGNVALSVG